MADLPGPRMDSASFHDDSWGRSEAYPQGTFCFYRFFLYRSWTDAAPVIGKIFLLHEISPIDPTLPDRQSFAAEKIFVNAVSKP